MALAPAWDCLLARRLLLEPLPAQFVNDVVDDLEVHPTPILDHAGGQGGVAECIDQPRNAGGEAVNLAECLWLEDLVGVAAGNRPVDA